MGSARGVTYGTALGAGLMFFLDPRRGAARRALIEQKARRFAHEVVTATSIGGRDLEHRLQGLLSKLSGKHETSVPDDVLVARVRSQLGRVCSHPHAVEAIAKGNGRIELKGPILRREVGPVVSAIERVRGVAIVEHDFDVRSESEGHPALLGGGLQSPSVRLPSPASRLVLGIGVAGIGLMSLLKGRPFGLLASGAVVLALARSIAHREVRPSLRRAAPLRREAPPVIGLREAYPPGSEWAPAPA
ncbi:MAG TPA: hypothetical protein VM580_33105 [Labilithrix sp.]|nr:hypothetical protein [Labilithrix sp.]